MELTLEYSTLILSGLLAFVLGYATFWILKRSLPKKLRAEHQQQYELVTQKARNKAEKDKIEARNRQEKREALAFEELETLLNDRKEDLEAEEAELTNQEQFASREESRVAKIENQYKIFAEKVAEVEHEFDEKKLELNQSRLGLQDALAKTAETDVITIQKSLAEDLVDERQLESQKRIKELNEQINDNAKKSAERVLARMLARYEPDFVWPKPTSHVELTSPKIIDQLHDDKNTIIQDIAAITDQVEISLVQEKPEHTPVIKLGGGYGIDKEAARLTLEELLPKGPAQWNKFDRIYNKHRQVLEKQAAKLGGEAARILEIESIHPEVQKMVGALNWRTSYRQNQFYHSLEVARLAGILAFELGVDPEIAKRCGLLHDIGKGLDYRIEGSHAVISGDYADRFGESKLVCDTVMSHHNDLVLDTPMSYVLKSADTLSGARPGARVNLEEGYQIRLSAIEEVVKSFPGIVKMAIMNGGREVHIEVNHKKIRENSLQRFTADIARKIEEDVAFPGQIKVLVSRRFESVAVA